jgi:hypothetical protein
MQSYLFARSPRIASYAPSLWFWFWLSAIGLGGSVKAQIVLTTADTIRASGNASQFEIVGYGGVVNQGASSVELRWLRVGSQLPSAWTHTICDLNSCYPPFVDSAEFTLSPRDTSNLDGHFYLNGQAGAGYQRIRLSTLPANAPLMVVTFVASTASSTTQTLISAPNKAAWKLVGRELILATEGLEGMAMVRVLDQSGREVYRKQITEPVERLMMDQWPSGVYMAILGSGFGTEQYRFALNR